MKYLSIDIEATGLAAHDQIIEFAAVPFDAAAATVSEHQFHCYLNAGSFEQLKPQLSSWVKDHMKEVIERSHQRGISLQLFKEKLTHYLKSPELRAYFSGEPIVLFGKSLNAIDLPFLNRDLGWDWMREHFSHRVCDLSSVCYFSIDRGLLPLGCERSSQLMKHFQMGEVAHTALEDAHNTALIYLKLVRAKE